MSRTLVERAQHGDHEAFAALAGRAFDRLYAVAYRILRDPGLAEDAVQDGLIRAWRDLRALRDGDRFDAWVSRLVVHACLDQARRRRRRPVEVAVAEIDLARSEEDVDALERRDQIERGFRRLSPEHRAVLVLHHYLGLRLAEVAEILGVPEGTVVSRLHYGARAMRSALEADLRGPGRVSEEAVG